jgi:hypothetical protein
MKDITDTMKIRQMQTGNGVTFFIDETDAEKIAPYRWHARVDRGGTWRITTTIVAADGKKTTPYLPRLILNAPADRLVDHKDGNGLNNTRSNLRLATRAQNNRNRRINKTASGGFKGVVRRDSSWEARIRADGARMQLGRFKSAEEAARMYDSAACHFYGEFARLNFPGEKPAPFNGPLRKFAGKGVVQ